MQVKSHSELRRLITFGLVGTCNTAICYALYAALVHWLQWHHNFALVADYCFGAMLGFLTHRGSTFADRTHLKLAFGKYLTALGISFSLNMALLNAIMWTGLLGALAAQAGALVFVTIVSYLMQRNWVFRSHQPSILAFEPAQVDDRAIEQRSAA
ncbi:MAG TPA: GtrA family protein [Pirellulales bacterium]|jgi:putative flippase GtrA|nr:GtrA family protein [Pirellulales bacterium]